MTRIGVGYFLLLAATYVALIAVDSDSEALGWVATAVTLGGALAAGVLAGRWRAIGFALLALPAAGVADLLWVVGVIDRSDEYEPVALSFVLVFYPWLLAIPALAVAVGVTVRQGIERRRSARAL